MENLELNLERLFSGMSTGLETVRSLESQYRSELDRKFASRFNYFDYISLNELSLSRIIASLLNPLETHGQGNLFLNSLIELLLAEGKTQTVFPSNYLILEGTRVSVWTEFAIDSGRRIDIVIEVSAEDGTLCLAIENKPYAEDQENQVKDYLDFLDHKYEGRFLLIYLSGYGEPPTKYSVDSKYLKHNYFAKQRFAILPYVKHHEEIDDYKDFRAHTSLVEWLTCCRRRCDAERLRSLLHDFEKFCQQEFGEQTMTTDSEINFIKEYLRNNPNYLECALAVSDAWPDLRTEICKNFFWLLSNRIEALIEEQDVLNQNREKFDFFSEFKVTKGSNIGLYLKSHNSAREMAAGKGEYCWIGLAADRPGPDEWWLGVEVDRVSDTETKEKIKSQMHSLFSNLRYWSNAQSYYWMNDLGKGVGDSMGHWSTLVPTLFKEHKCEKRETLDLYVQKFNWFAENALPKISETWSNYIHSK